MSATCNPKKSTPGPAADAAAPSTDADARPPDPHGAGTSPAAPDCPLKEASAPPKGAVVGPACPPALSSADPDLAKEIEVNAQELAAGFAAMGSAFGGRVSAEPLVLGRAVLQGPPHCYVIVALCKDGATAGLRVVAAGSEKGLVGPGPSLTVCPEASGPYNIAISAAEGEHACAARLYGD
jgi:hypothetical protein